MLIALVALWLSGSSGSMPMTAYLDHAREYAKKEITVKAQRDAVLDTLDDMKKAQDEFHKAEEKAVKAVTKLADNRDSKPADFQPAFAALRADSAESQEKLLQLRFRLTSNLTREQWAAVHAAAAPAGK